MSDSNFAATGKNTHVSISVDGTDYTEVFDVKNFTWGGKKKNFEEKTTLLSTNAYVQRAPTTKDPGTFTLNIFFNPTDAGQILLAASFDVSPDQLLTFQLQYDGPTLGLTKGPIRTFTGYVMDHPDPPADMSKLTEIAVQIQITGPITLTPGS